MQLLIGNTFGLDKGKSHTVILNQKLKNIQSPSEQKASQQNYQVLRQKYRDKADLIPLKGLTRGNRANTMTRIAWFKFVEEMDCDVSQGKFKTDRS